MRKQSQEGSVFWEKQVSKRSNRRSLLDWVIGLHCSSVFVLYYHIPHMTSWCLEYTSLPVDLGLGLVTCFDQWVAGRYDMSSLKCACTIGLALRIPVFDHQNKKFQTVVGPRRKEEMWSKPELNLKLGPSPAESSPVQPVPACISHPPINLKIQEQELNTCYL